MTNRSYKFKLSHEFIDDLKKIIRKYSYSRLIYNNDNKIIGYITFEESMRISALKKISDKIEWEVETSNFIKNLDRKNFNHYEIKKRII